MLLGEVADTPAVLPPDVEAYFFTSYRPPQSSAGLPGHFVPVEVPEEVLQRVLTAYQKDPSRAGDAGKIQQELAARSAYANDPNAYHPWTGDRLCTPCVAFRSMPWDWKGIHATPDPADPGRWYMTCGMLKDAGVIASQADCEREQRDVIQAYLSFQARLERAAKQDAQRRFTSGLVMSAIFALASFGVGAALGAASAAGVIATTTLSLLSTAMTSPQVFTNMDLGSGLKLIGGALLKLAPAIGGVAGQVIEMTVTTANSAKEFVDYMKSRGEISDALQAKADSIDGMLLSLDQLIRQRASFEELKAANLDLQAALNEALAEKRANDQKWLIGGVLAAGAVLLFSRRS